MDDDSVSAAARRMERAREEFPAATRLTYMNGGSRGLMSRRVNAVLSALIDEHTEAAGDKAGWQRIVAEARARFANLVNAEHADEVATVRNTSDGLNAVARAMPWQPGDNLVICAELEEPTTIYAWYALRSLGVEVRHVPARDGMFDIPRMIDAIDGRTRLLVASSVTWVPGLRTDIDSLGAACRERGIFFLVDAVQGLGVIPLDVRRSRVDGLAAATYKSLLGIHGLGYLYVRREWAEQMVPCYQSRDGVDFESAVVFEAGRGGNAEPHYAFKPAAQRFRIGHDNYAAAHAARESMGMLLDLGIPAIERHVTALTRRMAEGFLELGLPVVGGAPGPHTAHMVALGRRHPGYSDVTTHDPDLDALARRLAESDVVFSIRNGQLRFALHLYNNDEDVTRVLDLARAHCASRH